MYIYDEKLLQHTHNTLPLQAHASCNHVSVQDFDTYSKHIQLCWWVFQHFEPNTAADSIVHVPSSSICKPSQEEWKWENPITLLDRRTTATVSIYSQIGKSRAISSLGKLIKDKNPIDFKGFDSFKLWPAQLRLGSSVPDFHRFALDTTDKAPLELRKRISSYFLETPKGRIHSHHC